VTANPILALRSIEITTDSHRTQSPHAAFPAGSEPLAATLRAASGCWRADISLHSAADARSLTAALERGRFRFVIGDVGEVRAHAAPYANATLVDLDVPGSTITLTTSLTGLPPLFTLRGGPRVSVSSPFIPNSARGTLEPDIDGIADTLRWGHPLDGRTLFARLQAVGSHATVRVGADGSVEEPRPARWPSLEECASLSRTAIVREQVGSFAAAAARIDADAAFMSLSGGLDSRAALVALLRHGRRLPCVTMAGSPDNLDARLARAFCDANGLEHRVVLFDAAFRKRAPRLLIETAGLTAGVACLSQTADLFLYESVAGPCRARISGNLGNQVGRGGCESLSAYRPEPAVLAAVIRERLRARPVSPWFIPRLQDADYGAVLFGQEVHFWSIPNYVVGSSRALQLTPYADAQLLQLARAAFARDAELGRPTWRSLRARDLRHRLAGTPRTRSFQRQFLIENDRLGGRIPLNWGWRAAGGRSLRWSLRATVSAADAALMKLAGRTGPLQPCAGWLSARLGHRSALVDWRGLIRHELRELARDTFASRQVRESGIFDAGGLERVVSAHFGGAADHHATVARALEIALGVSSRAAPAASA
jgi:hypothetical protein